jgi:predicted PurR-regulated permease PerM
MNVSFQKLFYAIATAFLLFAILVFAKPILIPLSIALLISFILLPLAKKFEKWKIGKTCCFSLHFYCDFNNWRCYLLFFNSNY